MAWWGYEEEKQGQGEQDCCNGRLTDQVPHLRAPILDNSEESDFAPSEAASEEEEIASNDSVRYVIRKTCLLKRGMETLSPFSSHSPSSLRATMRRHQRRRAR